MENKIDYSLAQTAVKSLRQHLRRSQDYRQQGNMVAAAQEEKFAHLLGEQLMKGLYSTFQRYSLTLPNYDAQQDAMGKMMAKIWQGITDTSDSSEARRYELIFSKMVKWRVLTVIKQIRKQEAIRLACLSLDAPKQGEGNERLENLGDSVEDQRETLKVSRLLDGMVWQLFLQQIPSQKHKKIFFARVNGDTFEVAAQKAGVTAKTASKYNDEMYDLLKRLLRGEVSDIDVEQQRRVRRKKIVH